MEKVKTKMIGVHVDPDLGAKVEAEAGQKGLSSSSWVRMLILDFFTEKELIASGKKSNNQA